MPAPVVAATTTTTKKQKCPKCAQASLYFDKGINAWTCLACRWRDR